MPTTRRTLRTLLASVLTAGVLAGALAAAIAAVPTAPTVSAVAGGGMAAAGAAGLSFAMWPRGRQEG